ncbi:MAG: XRE family transcriptional regulator [Planctomycetota bacterium]|nr:MAG: XRE family transcriptional regulator [Planctomycetota bacterium]
MTKSIIDQLRQAIESADVSRYEIARQTGVAQQTLSKFVLRERGISLAGLDAVAEYLGLELVKRSKSKRPTK